MKRLLTTLLRCVPIVLLAASVHAQELPPGAYLRWEFLDQGRGRSAELVRTVNADAAAHGVRAHCADNKARPTACTGIVYVGPFPTARALRDFEQHTLEANPYPPPKYIERTAAVVGAREPVTDQDSDVTSTLRAAAAHKASPTSAQAATAIAGAYWWGIAAAKELRTGAWQRPGITIQHITPEQAGRYAVRALVDGKPASYALVYAKGAWRTYETYTD